MLKEYNVRVPYSGYSRGDDVYRVEAHSEEEAEKIVRNYGGRFLYRDVVRDDTEKYYEDAESMGEV